MKTLGVIMVAAASTDMNANCVIAEASARGTQPSIAVSLALPTMPEQRQAAGGDGSCKFAWNTGTSLN